MKYFIIGCVTGTYTAVRLAQFGISDYENAMSATMFGYVLMRFGLNPAVEYAAGFGVGHVVTQYSMPDPLHQGNETETQGFYRTP